MVSALAGVTDALLALASEVPCGGRGEIAAAVGALLSRHEEVAAGLTGADQAMDTIRADAEALIASLGANLGRDLRPDELDHLLGHGELWSSRLVAAAMVGIGLPAAWVDIRPILVTDDRFGRAAPCVPMIEGRARECIEPLLTGGVIPVTQGFIGATPDAVPTTLGRGGSDYTAALLGAGRPNGDACGSSERSAAPPVLNRMTLRWHLPRRLSAASRRTWQLGPTSRPFMTDCWLPAAAWT